MKVLHAERATSIGAARPLRGVADALTGEHARGVVHRDISPLFGQDLNRWGQLDPGRCGGRNSKRYVAWTPTTMHPGGQHDLGLAVGRPPPPLSATLKSFEVHEIPLVDSVRAGGTNARLLQRVSAHDARTARFRYRSDKSEVPTAGTETVDPLEFLARVLCASPDMGHVTTRHSAGIGPHGDRRAQDSRGALARSAIAPYSRRIANRPRLRFLSQGRWRASGWRWSAC